MVQSPWVWVAFLRLHHRAPHLGSGLPIEKQKNPLAALGKEKPVAGATELGGDCRAFDAPEARSGRGSAQTGRPELARKPVGLFALLGLIS